MADSNAFLDADGLGWMEYRILDGMDRWPSEGVSLIQYA